MKAAWTRWQSHVVLRFRASPSSSLLAPTLFGVGVIGFLLAYLLRGNPAVVKAGAGAMARPEYVARRHCAFVRKDRMRRLLGT
ncbi:hypothetical protein [Bradyrhizobium sp. CB2312]|uniref:hypothetical protein n=1 Tax=Bradyrhizobium sp. CB2312 TaxID=3039155 RepID=UPI0024B2224B|nr:hypothetical protein [Bradyrhizobium sp. CB2312]WFU71476.1 hypothetical protein QA642_40960 [Bradyrhizobium sp. CB2312]